jgi:DHA3 family macrolide efflux protein-like MFS transporter
MPISALLRNRNFDWLWLSHVAATVGEVLFVAGVVVLVYERTGSALQAVGVSIASMLPISLLGPLAGALVDRYPRRRVIVAGNLLRAGLVGSLLLVVGDGVASVGTLYATTAGLAAVTAFYTPARQALLPALVSQVALVRANSWMMMTQLGAYMAGFGLTGVLILSLGFRQLVLIDILLFVGATLLVALVRVPRSIDEPDVVQLPVLSSIGEGLSYLRDHRLARALITMETMEHVPHGMYVSGMMLVFTERALGADAAGWGYQNSAFFAGQLLGALLAVASSARLARSPGWVIIGNAFLAGLLTFAYAVSPSLGVAIAVSCTFGPPSAARDVAQDSLLQATVESGMLGRVYATRGMLAHLAFLLSGFAFAWFADQVPVRWVYGLGGLLYAGTAFYALASGTIRRSRIEEVLGERVRRNQVDQP